MISSGTSMDTGTGEDSTVSAFADAAFPSDVLCEILIYSGAWSPAANHSVEVKAGATPNHDILGGGGAVAAARPRICAWSVCQAWRDCLRGPPPDRLARLLHAVHGPDQALMRAVRCTSTAVDRCDLIRAVLGLPNVRADSENGGALIAAAHNGNVDVVRLLLEWKENAPRADSRDGNALVLAAEGGHEAVVRLLLGWREHAPRADCRDGRAMVSAAGGGHEAVVRLLLEWREHAVRADCQEGWALVTAAYGGHEAVVRLLLEWREHAPRADCNGGRPLSMAIGGGHEEVVRCFEKPCTNCRQ